MKTDVSPYFALLLALLFANGNCAILAVEWQKFNKSERYVGASIYPLGWAIAGKQADIGLMLKASNCFHAGIGIQGPDASSNLGLYTGPIYRTKDDRYGISTSITATALLFNLYLAHEYTGYHAMKFGLGFGVPVFWWIPNRKDRMQIYQY